MTTTRSQGTSMQWLRRRLQPGDDGVAIITVLLVGSLATLMGLTAVSVATNNLRNSGRDRVAGGALGAAEAGLAEAANHLRSANLGCLSGLASCAVPDPYVAGKTVTQPDGRTAVVKISLVQKMQFPTVKTAVFRVTANGTDGSGPGRRVLTQDVTVRPLNLPLSVYANSIALNGTPSVFQQSVVSKDCIGGRDKMSFGSPTSIDAAYGIPAAAHSETFIYEKACGMGDHIHQAGFCPSNAAYRYDQSSKGGPGPSGGTLPAACLGAGGAYPQTTYFGPGDSAIFGATDISPFLPTLRNQAKAMGQYWTSATGWTAPDASVHPNAVIYFKVGPNDTVKIQNELDAYTYSCASPRSIIIVVDNGTIGTGGAHLNSNNDLAGAMFVHKGNFQYNGTAQFTGPIFANTIDKWNGGASSQLTQCYLDNLPGGLLDITVDEYHEVDTLF